MLCIVKPKGWKSDNNIWHRSKQAADTLLHEKICFNQSVSRNVTHLPRKMINFQLINLEILIKEL